MIFKKVTETVGPPDKQREVDVTKTIPRRDVKIAHPLDTIGFIHLCSSYTEYPFRGRSNAEGDTLFAGVPFNGRMSLMLVYMRASALRLLESTFKSLPHCDDLSLVFTPLCEKQNGKSRKMALTVNSEAVYDVDMRFPAPGGGVGAQVKDRFKEAYLNWFYGLKDPAVIVNAVASMVLKAVLRKPFDDAHRQAKQMAMVKIETVKNDISGDEDESVLPLFTYSGNSPVLLPEALESLLIIEPQLDKQEAYETLSALFAEKQETTGVDFISAREIRTLLAKQYHSRIQNERLHIIAHKSLCNALGVKSQASLQRGEIEYTTLIDAILWVLKAKARTMEVADVKSKLEAIQIYEGMGVVKIRIALGVLKQFAKNSKLGNPIPAEV
jgi:hypothetical protein